MLTIACGVALGLGIFFLMVKFIPRIWEWFSDLNINWFGGPLSSVVEIDVKQTEQQLKEAYFAQWGVKP